jgi:hypothetical protein
MYVALHGNGQARSRYLTKVYPFRYETGEIITKPAPSHIYPPPRTLRAGSIVRHRSVHHVELSLSATPKYRGSTYTHAYEKPTPSRTQRHLQHLLDTLWPSTRPAYELAPTHLSPKPETPCRYSALTVLSNTFLLLHYSGVQNVKKLMRPTPPSTAADLKETDRPLDAQAALPDL